MIYVGIICSINKISPPPDKILVRNPAVSEVTSVATGACDAFPLSSFTNYNSCTVTCLRTRVLVIASP